MIVRCSRCQTEGHARLCDPCRIDLYTDALTSLHVHLPLLLVTITRQDETTRAVVHRGPGWVDHVAAQAMQEQAALPAWLRSKHAESALAPHALPINLDAADVLADVRSKVAGWLDTLGYGRPRRPVWLAGPAHTPNQRCGHQSCEQIRAARTWRPPNLGDQIGWLTRHVDNLLLLPERGTARRILSEAQRAAAQVEDAVDNREPDVYVGPCDTPDVTVQLTADDMISPDVAGVCGTHMYARIDDDTVVCPTCGYEYPIADRREWLLDAVRNLLERPAVIAAALTTHGMPLKAATLDQWIHRDKQLSESGRLRRDGLPLILADAVYSDDGKPLYRIGDVMDRLVAAGESRQAARMGEGRTA